MNAYELADELQELITAPTPVDDADACKLIDETAIALRQQAEKISNMEQWEKRYLDRIAELEKENNRLQDHMTELRKIHTERIEAVEKELNHMQSFYGCDPAYYGMKQSKPVAWMKPIEFPLTVLGYPPPPFQLFLYAEKNAIPLYTHPVKQLSDEEIYELWIDAKQTALNTKGGIVELCFARAIIKEITE